jgi:predicted nuclease of predicted toxin-antitoxin system
VKFLVDMPQSPALAHWFVARGHEAVHAPVLGLDRAPDVEILARSRPDPTTMIFQKWQKRRDLCSLCTALAGTVRIYNVSRTTISRRTAPDESTSLEVQ